MRRGRVTRALGALVLLLAVGGAAFAWVAGSRLVAPARHTVGEAPADLAAEPVEITTGAGGAIRGWWCAAPAEEPRGVAVLLHPLRGDRRAMIGRARLVRGLGFDALLVDLPGHGESDGDVITAGYRERHGARAAVEFARQRRPEGPLVAIGWSLGGAALLLAHRDGELDPGDLDAVVLEAVYPSLEIAVENRLAMRFGPPGRWLAPLLTLQTPLRIGCAPEELRPVDHLRRVTARALILNGTEDARTTVADARSMRATAVVRSRLVLIEGAGHEDLLAHSPEAYEAEVTALLESAVASPGR